MTIDLYSFARDLEQLQRQARLDRRSRTWKPSATPATSLGYRCERRTYYQLTEPELAAPISEELASIFEEGGHHEKQIRRELSELGFEVVETELNFRDANLWISGTIDGKLLVPGANTKSGYARVPVEIKSWSGSSPVSAAAMRDNDGLLGRYFAQMQTYLVLTAEPVGLFLFKSKLTGLWSIVPCELDFDYAEVLLKRAERLRDAVKEKRIPERLADRGECVGCPWKDTLCHPEEEEIDPLLLTQDTELATQIEEREELDGPRRRYKQLDDKIKARFKMSAGDRWVAGDFLVTKKKHGRGVRIDIKRFNKEDQDAS